MAAIVAIHGKIATLTINSVAALLSRGTVRVNTPIAEYSHTGQTADSDSQYWTSSISGVNSWSVEADGYIDHNATAASRLIGTSLNVRPGTAAAGAVAVLFNTGHGFTGAVIVEEMEMSYDTEGNKPSTFRCRLKGNGALTYTNS